MAWYHCVMWSPRCPRVVSDFVQLVLGFFSMIDNLTVLYVDGDARLGLSVPTLWLQGHSEEETQPQGPETDH